MAGEIAISDVGTMLYSKVAPAELFSELIGITGAPATGADAGTIEVTTLKSTIKQYIADRKDTPAMNFNYNYTEENYASVVAVCDGASHDFLMKLQDGSGFVITGQANTYTTEIGRGSGIGAVINIVASNVVHKTKAEVDVIIETPSV